MSMPFSFVLKIPLLEHIGEITKPFVVHVTLTGYHEDFEPNVDKKDIFESIKKIATIIGPERMYIRYDPIIVNDKYTIDYHIKSLTRIAEALDGFVKTIIISFVDDYKNVRKNAHILNIKPLTDADYEKIGRAFSQIAHDHGMKIQTCAEKENLRQYGFDGGECMSYELAASLTGKDNHKRWNERKSPYCNCVKMVDIGAYNTCRHFCRYCYANYDAVKVDSNAALHDPNSSLLLGHLVEDDVIKVRKS